MIEAGRVGTFCRARAAREMSAVCAETLRVQCPNCGVVVIRSLEREAPYFPFCSERCKLIDLGKWFRGVHRIEEALPGTEESSEPGEQSS